MSGENPGRCTKDAFFVCVEKQEVLFRQTFKAEHHKRGVKTKAHCPQEPREALQRTAQVSGLHRRKLCA